MASGPPVVRQIHWISFFAQLMLMGLLMWILSAFVELPLALSLGALTYIAISLSFRHGIPKAHRRGMKLVRLQEYDRALEEFERSHDFFSRNQMLDQVATFFSTSRSSFREIALLNMAYCCIQSGHSQRAKDIYRRTLEDFPNSNMARVSLRTIESIEQSMKTSDTSGNSYEDANAK